MKNKFILLYAYTTPVLSTLDYYLAGVDMKIIKIITRHPFKYG